MKKIEIIKILCLIMAIMNGIFLIDINLKPIITLKDLSNEILFGTFMLLNFFIALKKD